MKKIVKVSIARFSFTLEESAHILLDNYINDLKAFYTPTGEQDVVDGIEERVAELLLERGGKDNVITLAMVDEIISILGKPEDIEDSTGDGNKTKSVPKKRLFRDPQNKVVSGVCGGLAAYTGLDVVFVRIIFAIVMFLISVGVSKTASVDIPAVGVLLLFYFALVAIIPKAVTVEQRCQMRGEAEDVHQIRKNVMDMEYYKTGNPSVM
ncbi:MAG: PspC domain-containing protein, partial [Bacteroidia bacterium]|nr:PspC domain-containing protein [Bacteroidia bacterium]